MKAMMAAGITNHGYSYDDCDYYIFYDYYDHYYYNDDHVFPHALSSKRYVFLHFQI